VEPPQDTSGGDYYYRTHAPGLAMAAMEGVFVVNLTSEHRRKWEVAERADVLVLKNVCDPDLLPLIKARKEHGKVTVYEIADDLSAIEPWNPVHFFYKNPENRSLVWRLAGYCNALQVTCSRLKELYGRLNPICRVFPNQVSHVPPEKIRKKRNGLVIGWGGSHGHLQDMEEVAEPLSCWIAAESGARLHVMASEPILKLFGNLPEKKRRFFPTGSIEEYYSFLRRIDVGIGPLKDTPFNRSRSDVKFLEYAVSGVVPVMRRLDPYADSIIPGETGFLYVESQELISHLSHLSRDPLLLKKVAESARNYVLGNRLETAHAHERVDFYRSLLQKRHLNASSSSPRELFDGLSSLKGAAVTGRHLRLAYTEFETLLHEGLVAMQVREENNTALRLFHRAAEMEPENYLPCLYASPASADPEKILLKAIALNPFSLKARIMLGESYARRGRPLEALKCFGEAAEIFSGYEIPYKRAASLLHRIGHSEKASMLETRAASLCAQFPPQVDIAAIPRAAAS